MVLMSTANYKPGLLALDERPPRVYDRGGRDAGTTGAAGRKNNQDESGWKNRVILRGS